MSKGKPKPLRFATLIRVSTEKQAAKGESLRTQRTQIESAVESLGGKVSKHYAGQEHGTAGWERQQLDALLGDAQKSPRPFDAVIVADASRWSRDNARSKAGLQILRDAGVRFFTLTTEHDLYEPQAILFLGMAAEFNEFQARMQKKKAVDNKIERAKRGIPTNGRLPYGRTFDRATSTWGVDAEKKATIEAIAKRYLGGEGLDFLATEYHWNYATLWRTLRHLCGDTWPVTYSVPDLNIAETITHQVPRLLSEKTIKALHQRMEANRTYLHGSSKHEYLLQGRIFCAGCGRLMTGAITKYLRKYRHNPRSKDCPLNPKPHVRADDIEQAVLAKLFDMLGSPATLQQAVKDAIPDCDKLLNDLKKLDDGLRKNQQARDRILTMIEKDTITDEQAEQKLLALKERDAALQLRKATIDEQLQSAPDVAALSLFDQDGAIVLMDDEGNTYAGGNDVASWLWLWDDKNPEAGQQRRAIVESAFGTPLPDGSPAGVYVTPAGGKQPGQFSFELRGQLWGNQGATLYAPSDRRRSAPR